MPGKDIKLEAGQCIDSIAYKEEVPAAAIWDHPENQELKEQRKDPNVMMPGDPVHIPDPTMATFEGKQTGLTHVFQRSLPKKKFVFEVVGHEALEYTGYKVEVDGALVKTGDNEARVSCMIAANAQNATITLKYKRVIPGTGAVGGEHVYTVRLGRLRPLDTPEGQEDRLKNLGFGQRVVHRGGAAQVPTFPEAMELFQTSNGIEPADKDALQRALEQLKNLTGDCLPAAAGATK